MFSAENEFSRFFAPSPPEIIHAPLMVIPSAADQKQAGDDHDMEASLPPIDPAMFRPPFPSSESMKSDMRFPDSPMQQTETGTTASAAATPQSWLSESHAIVHC